MAKLEKQSTNPPPGQIKHDDHSIGTLDPTTYQGAGDPHPGEMWFNYPGSGNLPTNYNISVDDKTDIELGLKIHERQGPDILPVSVDPDGTAHYEVAAGYQAGRAPSDTPANPNDVSLTWNFDFSVNTGLDGSSKTLDAFDFRIVITSGDGEQGVFDLRHLAPGNTPWGNATNTAGFGDEDGLNPQLSQNSVNLGFTFLSSIFGLDVADVGETYDVVLQAFDHGKIVAQVHDVIVLV
jgi:hypothetical protein